MKEGIFGAVASLESSIQWPHDVRSVHLPTSHLRTACPATPVRAPVRGKERDEVHTHMHIYFSLEADKPQFSHSLVATYANTHAHCKTPRTHARAHTLPPRLAILTIAIDLCIIVVTTNIHLYNSNPHARMLLCVFMRLYSGVCV